MRPANCTEYRAGTLFCEEVSLTELAAQVGTPAYIYSSSTLSGNFQTLSRCFEPIQPKICYAVKANSNLSLLRVLRNEGSSFDIVSGGELYRLNQIGVDPEKIIYSGVGKTRPELLAAASQKIFAIVIESRAELETLSDLTRTLPTRISLRINPDVDARTHPYISTGLRRHKFGIDPADVSPLLERIAGSRSLSLVGIGSHIGSQILEATPFVSALQKIRELADSIRSQGFPLRHLDLGGGFGIPYEDESHLDLNQLASAVRPILDGYELIMEPGRYLVASAGILLTRVLYTKRNDGKTFVVADAAMNDLIRPALYQAYHRILPVEEREEQVTADLVGPVCETADFLAKDRKLPHLKEGDLVAVLDAGAYGFVASSNYNSRPRAVEVLVEGDQYRVVRERESYEDLIRGEA